MGRIDDFVMTRLDSCVGWLWYRWEVKKIDLMRGMVVMWVGGGTGFSVLLNGWWGMAGGGVYLLIGTVTHARAEFMERMLSVGARNALVAGWRSWGGWFRGMIWGITVMDVLFYWLPPVRGPLVLDMLNCFGFLAWFLLEDTFWPEGPTRRVKKVEKIPVGRMAVQRI